MNESILGASIPAAILETIEDFQMIYSPGSGAVLYPARLAETSLHGNLSAAAIATTLRVSSLDAAKHRFGTVGAPTVAPAVDAYRRASALARDHVASWLNRLKPQAGRSVNFGTFAATVAMHRATAGFSAAHILYSLGYNYEGDAVARQILEQVAWSFAASLCGDDEPQIEALAATPSIAILRRKLLPHAGRLYGELSRRTHADLDEHRAAFSVNSEQQGLVSLAWGRTVDSARNLLDLSDAWASTWQFVQFDYLESCDSVLPDRTLDPARPFLAEATKALEGVRAAQDD